MGAVVLTNPSATVTQYNWINAGQGSTGFNATENIRQNVIPTSLTISNLTVNVNTACGSAKSLAFTLYKNGSATNVTCQITGTSQLSATSAPNLYASFSAGDTVSIQCVPSGTPTVSSTAWAMDINTLNPRESILLCATDSVNETFRGDYCPMGGGNSWWYLQADSYMICPTNGWIKNMYSIASGVSGGTGFTYAMDINTSLSAFTYNIGSAVTTGNNAGSRARVAAGDKLSFYVSPIAFTETARTHQIGLVFEADVEGESWSGWGSRFAMYTGWTLSDQVYGYGRNTPAAAENQIENITTTIRAIAMYASVAVAPGAGTSWTFTLRCKRTNAEMVCQIADSATSASARGNINFQAGDRINWNCVSVGSVALTPAHGGVLFKAGVMPIGNNIKPHPFQPGLAR